MKKQLLILFFLISISLSYGEVIPKVYKATFSSSEIKIDGYGNDVAWKDAVIATDFIQLDPVEGDQPTQRTEVRLMYDNTAIYIFAHLFDSSPDSILHELGNRDESQSLNSDGFRIGLDPYNKRQNGYVFEVTASGVQNESFNDDLTFDAVWQSAVVLGTDGWTVEIKIPYSAIRFPAIPVQTWGLQFARLIRRNREYDQWTLTPKKIQNRIAFWGTLTGIENIEPPIRLNLTPYLSLYDETNPHYENGVPNGSDNSFGYSGGADIKYGIDERFTIDMTLLPDFSQVQSDNKVKNLSAFETIYNENRPFFKEGTSLFKQGNLFYSRRIGQTPSLFYDVPYLLAPGEQIVDNPDKARLINATKLSGRTNNGLGIGILNAITSNTYAKIKTADGGIRKILTEPLTNYNVLILDQQLKNNSGFYFSNANTTRDGKARDANVSAVQFHVEDKTNTFSFKSGGTYSHTKEWTQTKIYNDGYQYFLAIDKVKGTHQYGLSYELADKKYDKNDLGYNFYRDYTALNAYWTIQAFNPFWKYFKQGNISPFFNRYGLLSKKNEVTNMNAGFNFFVLTNKNWSYFCEFGGSLVEQRDHYEPRVENKFVKIPVNTYGSVNVTTNYNKRIAFDFGGRYNLIKEWNSRNYGYYIAPVFRINDKMKIRFENYFDVYNNDRGFVNIDYATNDVYFGKRNVITISNALTGRYLIKNDMSITLTGRHYWSRGKYASYFLLSPNGELISTTTTDLESYNFNSNYFTLDLVYNWQFAPGSSLIVTFKNAINSENNITQFDYFSSLNKTFNSPQSNAIYLKILYYLDYQYFVKKKSN